MNDTVNILRRARGAGFSIIEMMVAVTISMILFTVIIELFASNKEAYRIQEGASQLNENARYAMSHLQYYMRMGDHWGGVEPDNVTVNTSADIDALNALCTGAGNQIVSNVGFRGYEGAASAPVNCITDYEPNTDAFFIRYGAPRPEDPTLEPDNGADILSPDGLGVWIRTSIGRLGVIFDNADFASLPAGFEIPADPNDPDPLHITNYGYEAMLYFIRPCSNPGGGSNAAACDADDDGVPTLARKRLQVDGANLVFREEGLVKGVEAMRVLYGIDENADFVADRYREADDIPAGDWNQVVSARVSLIISNPKRDMTITDTKDYDMVYGPDWNAPSEAQHFRRSKFDFVVQIRNQTRA